MLGKILLAALFVVTGAQALLNFDNFKGSVAKTGLPMTDLVAMIALAFKLGGGLALLFGLREDLAIDALLLFTAAATVFFHNPIVDPSQMTQFLKNLSIIGGLMLIG